MSNKSEVSDYEPVTRSSSSCESRESENEWRCLRNAKNSLGSLDPGTEVVVQQTSQAIRQERSNSGTIRQFEPTKKNSILKRGHAITFAGLFLFTFDVYFRPYELISALSWATSSTFVIAVLTLAVFVPTQLGLEGRLTVRPREVNLVLLLLMAALFSVPFALDRVMAWGHFTEFLKVIVMFIVMVNVVRTEKRLKSLILLVLVASCVLSISAFNDYRMGNYTLKVVGFTDKRIMGVIGGLFANPNDLALHLVTMVPLAIGLMLGSKGFITKVLYVGGALLMIGGIVATFSRGGFLGLVCVAVVLAWNMAQRHRVLIGPFVVVILLAFAAIAPSDYRSRISTTDDESATARKDDLKRSIFLTIRHPFLGVGLGNYILYSNSSKETHNAYTQVGAEMGIWGMLMYLLFQITPLKRLRKIRKETSPNERNAQLYWLALGLEASLMGYMVTSFFASVAYLWYVYYLVGYSFCLSQLYEAQRAESKNNEPTSLGIS